MDGNFAGRSDDERWSAIAARDAAADGRFWFGVSTTGVFCLPSCPARRPKRENVRYFASPAAAERAGFRPCRRCRPHERDRRTRQIAGLCRWIEAQEEPPRLAAMAERVGLSPGHLHRIFRQALGITPRQFAEAVRARRLKAGLSAGASVTHALYEAGFGGASGFYDTAGARLGMRPQAWRRGGAGQVIRWTTAACALGTVLVAATDRGVCAILLGDDAEALRADLEILFGNAEIERTEQDSDFAGWVGSVIALIDHPASQAKLPLDIRGTAFQERVWRALRAIPAGETATYAEIAAAIGRPASARAVAAACAANRLAVAIPCHRAVRSDGGLAGYRWGVARKRALLDREAANRRGR